MTGLLRVTCCRSLSFHTVGDATRKQSKRNPQVDEFAVDAPGPSQRFASTAYGGIALPHFKFTSAGVTPEVRITQSAAPPTGVIVGISGQLWTASRFIDPGSRGAVAAWVMFPARYERPLVCQASPTVIRKHR